MTTADTLTGTDSVGVRYEQDGPIATVTLCRPEVLNAQTPAMWSELGNISRKLPGDVRVVIVRGEGRAFSAGLDLSVAQGRGDSSLAHLARLPAEECAERIAGFQSAFTWLRQPSIVTIATVQGHAIGAGFQLALNCDMRVLADDAQFSMAEVLLGLVPDLGGTKPPTRTAPSPSSSRPRAHQAHPAPFGCALATAFGGLGVDLGWRNGDLRDFFDSHEMARHHRCWHRRPA